MKKWTFLTMTSLLAHSVMGAISERAEKALSEPQPPKVTPTATHEPKRPGLIRRCIQVTLEKQMEYQEVALKYGMTVQELNELNELALEPNTMLAKGSELCVYVRY